MSRRTSKSSDRPQRATVVYQGRVQGVGFRYTTVRVAEAYEVTGHVANLPDGTVRVVAEGDPGEVRSFLEGVRASAVGRHIIRHAETWSPATGEFASFTVRYAPW